MQKGNMRCLHTGCRTGNETGLVFKRNLICMYRFAILVLFLNLWTTYSVEKRPKGQSTLSTRAWVKGISQNTCFFCLFVALFYIMYIFLFLNVESGILNFKSLSKTAWLITNSSSGIVGMTNDAHLVLVKFLSFILFFILKIVIIRKTEKNTYLFWKQLHNSFQSIGHNWQDTNSAGRIVLYDLGVG